MPFGMVLMLSGRFDDVQNELLCTTHEDWGILENGLGLQMRM
jgi:hypothetical protein